MDKLPTDLQILEKIYREYRDEFRGQSQTRSDRDYVNYKGRRLIQTLTHMATPRSISRSGQDEFGGEPWNGLVDLCAMEPMSELTSIQRVAHLAFWYMSEVNNGGHFQYFYNKADFDHGEVLAALERIGATQCASILAEAVSHLRALKMQRPQTLEEYVESEAEAEMTKLDTRYFEVGDPEFLRCMEAYLKSNESEFVRWVE